LKLRSSFFDNPHGLMNQNSKSTAFDIAKLSSVCMEDARFRKVVGTKFYSVAKNPDIGINRSYRWENTNKLLEM
jgi:D-alanyl-D-alanine carboxypeptidase